MTADRSKKFQKALDAINSKGFLLVFPINNKRSPDSLWYNLHPQTQMRWEWDETGDGKLFELWRLREELARSREVVYGKYFQNRATFFSKSVFTDLLAIKGVNFTEIKNTEARNILSLLEMDSPLSTKQLKESSELKGKFFEASYHRALKELWQRLAIVGVGEIDDGAFPSLAHSATKTEFEDLWLRAQEIEIADAWMRLCDLPEFHLLEKYFLQNV